MPIWFVKFSDLIAKARDGSLTIGELESITWMKASADSFLEVLQPGPPGLGANIPKITIVTSGVLERGGSFFMFYEDTTRPFSRRPF